MNFLNIETKDNTANITIDGIIGDPFDGSTKQGMKNDLQEINDLDVDEIIVNISTPGGSVDHALAIHDMLASHPAEVETRVTGMTASAGTIIAQAGNTRKMSDNAMYLIHQARIVMLVSSNKMEEIQETLGKIDNRIARIYAKRSERDTEDFLELMSQKHGDGTWLSAEEALEHGLIDEITEPLEVVNYSDKFFNKYDLPKPDCNTEDDDFDPQGVSTDCDSDCEVRNSLTDKIEVGITLSADLEDKLDELTQTLNGENMVVSKVNEGPIDNDTEVNHNTIREREIELLKIKSKK